MGGYSVCKLVKPIKILCSWTPHQAGVSHFLLSKAESNIRTGAAGILGKADATVGKELRGLDSSDRVLDQAAEFFALLIGNGGAQVLNLDQPLANENYLSDFRDARYP